MQYHLNRGLFVENGPTVLADRTREALAVSSAYRLMAAKQPKAKPASETTPARAAA